MTDAWEAWRDGDKAATLRLLVAMWAEIPHPDVADAIDHLDRSLALELGGWDGSPKRISARFQTWSELDAVERIGATTALFKLNRIRFAEALEQVAETRDPRLASGLRQVAYSRYHQWDSWDDPVRRLWQALGDPRGVRILPRYSQQKWATVLFPKPSPVPNFNTQAFQPLLRALVETREKIHRLVRRMARALRSGDLHSLQVEADRQMQEGTVWGELLQLESTRRAGGKASTRQIRQLEQRLEHGLFPRLACIATKIRCEWGLPRSCELRSVERYGLPLESNEPAVAALTSVKSKMDRPPAVGWEYGSAQTWIRIEKQGFTHA